MATKAAAKSKKTELKESVPFESGENVISVDVEDLGNDGESDADTPKSTVSMEVTKIVAGELARLDPFKKRLGELKEKYGGITIKDVDDTEGYEQAKIALADMRGIRNRSKDEADAAKKPLADGIKSINENLAFITTGVKEIEDPLLARRREIDAEAEKIKAEKKRKKDEQYIQRQQMLYFFGAKYEDGNFVLNDVVYDAATIRELDEEIWLSDVMPEYQEIFDVAEADRLAKQKVLDDAAALLKTQQEAFQKQQDEFKKQQDEFKKQQDDLAEQKRKDAEEKRKTVVSGRVNILESLGMTYNFNRGGYVYGDLFVDVNEKDKEELSSDAEFSAIISEITPKINEAKRVAAENEKKEADAKKLKQEQDATGKARYDLLSGVKFFGSNFEDLGQLTTEAWDQLYKEKKDAFDLAAKQAADKAKQEQMDAATDKQKWASVIEYISKVPIPEMKSPSFKAKMQSLKSAIDKLKTL